MLGRAVFIIRMKRTWFLITAALISAGLSENPSSAELLTVATAPGGLTVTVDGTNYTAPVTFDWPAGSLHSLAAPSPQLAGDGHSRSSFAAWSDGGAQSHSVTGPASDATNTASFTTQLHHPGLHRG